MRFFFWRLLACVALWRQDVRLVALWPYSGTLGDLYAAGLSARDAAKVEVFNWSWDQR